MEELILEEMKDFKNTEPIFVIKLSSDCEDIILSPIKKYMPTPKQDNVLSELACKNYSESFRVSDYEVGYVYRTGDMVSACRSDIRKSVCQFLDKNLGLRNPRQSKLYRWAYRDMPEAADNSILQFYKYIKPYCNDNMELKDTADKGHIANAIALIELIRGKYEK